jgi:FMN phosphatase YigB (HAD superfamily)
MSDYKKPIFVFDLHEVVVHRNYWKMAYMLAKLAYRIDILLHILRPSSLKTLKNLYQKSRVPEEYFVTIAKNYPPMQKVLPELLAIINQHTPNQEVITLIQELKKEGYTVHLFSNIGENTWHQFKNFYPAIALLFDQACYAQEIDNWVQKPQLTAFNKFLSIASCKSNDCVFIDNSFANIRTAQTCGFKTIHVKNTHHIKPNITEYIQAIQKEYL